MTAGDERHFAEGGGRGSVLADCFALEPDAARQISDDLMHAAGAGLDGSDRKTQAFSSIFEPERHAQRLFPWNGQTLRAPLSQPFERKGLSVLSSKGSGGCRPDHQLA